MKRIRESLLALCWTFPLMAQDCLDRPAPPLAAPAWALGTPITSFEPGKVYVVQFLQDSARKIAERKPFGNWFDDLLPKVEPVLVFCDSWRLDLEKLRAEVAPFRDSNLRVAFDPGRALHDAWIQPTGGRAPITMVVDKDGRLIWFGNKSWMNHIVEAALADKDTTKAREELVALQKRASQLMGKVVDKAGADAAVALCKEYPPAAAFVLHYACHSLNRAGEFALADRLAPAAIEALIIDRDEVALDGIAWSFVDPASKRTERQLDLALKAAQAAIALDKEPHGEHLRTLARVWFWKGDLDRAIAVQKQAIAATEDPDDHPPLQKTLQEYEAAKAK